MKNLYWDGYEWMENPTMGALPITRSQIEELEKLVQSFSPRMSISVDANSPDVVVRYVDEKKLVNAMGNPVDGPPTMWISRLHCMSWDELKRIVQKACTYLMEEVAA
jgi:hypothetical protein